MPGRELTPQDRQYKLTISSNLNSLLKKRGLKQIDVANALGLSFSTINGYFNAKRLPSPENVEKLANFFHVDKSEIDPRYSKAASPAPKDEADLDKMLDQARSFNGKPMDDHDRELIRNVLKRMYDID